MTKIVSIFSIVLGTCSVAWSQEQSTIQPSIPPQDSLAVLDSLPVLAALPVEKQQQTCSELYQQIKTSDCGKKVFRWIDGIELELGLAINTATMDLANRDDEDDKPLATMESVSTPSPYYSVRLPNSYIWKLPIAWSVSVGYRNLFGYYQEIDREENELSEIDVGTYFSASTLFVSPMLAFVYGGQDEDPNKYVSLGVGVGAGLASVKGTAIFTEDKSNDQCYQASIEVFEGRAAGEYLKNYCDVKKYKYWGFGVSTGAYIEARYSQLILGLYMDYVGVRDKEYFYLAGRNSFLITWLIAL